MCNEQNTPLSVSQEELNDTLIGTLAMFDIIVCSAELFCKHCKDKDSETFLFPCPIWMIRSVSNTQRADLQKFMEKAGGEE